MSFLDDIAKMVGELNPPFTNGFVAYVNTSEGKLILNISIAMVKAVVRPHSLVMMDNGKQCRGGETDKVMGIASMIFLPF